MSDNDNHNIASLSSLLPQEAFDLLESTGKNLVETVGIDVICDVVLDVLTGRNIRASTESLTRRRIAAINLALVNLFIQGSAKLPDFVERLPHIASEILATSNPKTEEWLANWMIGLTGKGVQNILRDDHSLIANYRDAYIKTCQDIVEQNSRLYGELTGTIKLGSGAQVDINWLFMLYLLNTVGSETLTIRGSEKSLYGKFFEKLVLGSLLHILGFEHIQASASNRLENVFWLSSNSERERESDATILYKPGKGIRIDIGFIGRGNTEISLDKVSRYRREIEMGDTHWYMGTIIIVDRIGPRSRIRKFAEEIDGTIVQMSAGYWPKRIALTLNEIMGYQHPLIDMDENDIEDYLQDKLREVPLMSFVDSAMGSKSEDN